MGKRIISILIVIILILSIPVSGGAADRVEIRAAYTLYNLDLFKGTGTNSDGTPIFDLDDPLNRLQAVIMLVRMLGKEEVARMRVWDCPFEDVPYWAKSYVGYAYSNGLTLGVDEKRFGSHEYVSAGQYISFILRALGYDSSVDFEWNKAWELSDSIGLTSGQYNENTIFLRSDAVTIALKALSARIKGTDTNLLGRLYSEGVVTGRSIAETGLSDLLQQETLTAAQVSAKASPAVFYLEVYKSESDYLTGVPTATGSGFFITENGVAVTNYHVLEGTALAYITTLDGMKYEVTHIIYRNKIRDIAVVKISNISKTGAETQKFPYLEMASSGTINDGDQIYTISSPLGLQNTITDGIVSNKNRLLFGQVLPYIQITAAISQGSSGGALLNARGQAIGVTTSSITYGQNINLAVPLDSILNLDLEAEGEPYLQVYEEYKTEIRKNSVGYEEYKSVPDFGKYFNIPVFFKNVTDSAASFFYSIDDIIFLGSYSEIYNIYDTLLETWGFKLSGYFPDNIFYIWVYNNDEGLKLCFGPMYLEDSLTVCVMIMQES
ncbi:MAG: serine protease [Clostridiales bacterium]|jgi:hypothetical protein|nr:serine protease [Clostridiales bacterium]